jgi:hypothetical protein
MVIADCYSSLEEILDNLGNPKKKCPDIQMKGRILREKKLRRN